MSRALEARVEKLEQAMGAREQLLVVIHSYTKNGELYGYGCNLYGMEPLEVTRQSGESDEHLLDRAGIQAQLAGMSVNGCVALRELRR